MGSGNGSRVSEDSLPEQQNNFNSRVEAEFDLNSVLRLGNSRRNEFTGDRGLEPDYDSSESDYKEMVDLGMSKSKENTHQPRHRATG
jgi:hypothetical protein